MDQAADQARITLRDIASAMGISVSAVNKALNGRSGVSDALRVEVVKTANEMGYRVNRMAQSMSRTPIKIGILLPDLWPLFYGAIRNGMDAKLKELADYRITAEYYILKTLYSRDEIIKGIHYFIDNKVNALVICTNFVTDYGDCFDLLEMAHIPTVLVGSDLPNAKRLCTISHDADLAGKLAAEFVQYVLPSGKRAAVFVGNKNMNDHQVKARSFFDFLNQSVNPLTDIHETLDDPDVAYAVTRRVLQTQTDLGAIYVATSNTVAVCQAIVDSGRQNDISVIGTDIIAEMEAFFHGGPLRGVIFQDPYRQGKLAIEILFDYLTLGKLDETEKLIYPSVVFSSNFPYYVRNIFHSLS